MSAHSRSPKKYFKAHKTDKVLGRTGTTLDWPKTIKDFDPADWNNFTKSPPRGSDWRDFLSGTKEIYARNAVRPFHIFFDYNCNLLIASEQICSEYEGLNACLKNARQMLLVHGKRQRRCVVAGLEAFDVLAARPFSPENEFLRVDSGDYHIHGTRVQRDKETRDQVPEPIESRLKFDSFGELRSASQSLTKLYPSFIELPISPAPALFSIGQDLYVEEQLAAFIDQMPEPGVSFPYPHIEVVISPK